MNLKSLITVAAVATAGAALAVYESPVKLCQIKVDSAYTNTILALPLVNVGNDGDTVNPTNMILTTGLKAGTYLYTNTGKNKAGWSIATDSGPWTGTQVIDGNEQSAEGSASRGTGVWLVRNGVTEGQESIYIYGQLSGNAVTSTVNAASYTMVGNASTNAVRLTGLKWVVPPAVGDEVMFIDDSAYGVTNKFTCKVSSNPTSWTYETITTSTSTINGMEVTVSEPTQTDLTPQSSEDPVIYPGQGFFYHRKNTEDPAPKIEW